MFGELVLTLALLSAGILAIKDATPSYKIPPSDTKAAKDHDVTMYCQVDNKGKNGLYWHCNNNNGNQDVTVGPNENTNPALSKYIIDNSGAEIGQYNLVVTNVTELDSGRCTCIVDSGTGNAIEAGADLDVMLNTERPNTPTCVIDKVKTPGRATGEFVADDYVLLTCESQRGVPLPKLHWEIFRTSNNGRGVKILSSITATTDSIKAVAEYTFTNLDDGAYFQCVQTHVTLPDKTAICNFADPAVPGSINVPLVVLYPPVLRFVPSSLKVTPLETTRETLKCEYDANPGITSGPSIRYVPANPNDKLDLVYTTAGLEDSIDLVLTQDDNGKVIECVAENELGSSVTKLKIESTGLLPTWILVIIIGGGGLVFFFIVAVICCICFCDGNDDRKDRHSIKKSRLEGSEMDGSEGDMYNSEEGGYNDYIDHQDMNMVPINDFEGGRELKDDFQNENAAYDEYEDDMSDASPIQTKASSRTYDQVPID